MVLYSFYFSFNYCTVPRLSQDLSSQWIFSSHWHEVFILWWRSPLPWQSSRNSWGFQKYLNISYPFRGVSLQKTVRMRNFPCLHSNQSHCALSYRKSSSSWVVGCVFSQFLLFRDFFQKHVPLMREDLILIFALVSTRAIILYVFPMISKWWNYKLEFLAIWSLDMGFKARIQKRLAAKQWGKLWMRKEYCPSPTKPHGFGATAYEITWFSIPFRRFWIFYHPISD